MPITTACTAAFAYHGIAFSAVMLDLSELGAKFRLNECVHPCELRMGDELSIEVITPYGTALCAGTIAWTQHSDELYEWGVCFTRLSPNPNDPLRSLMDSDF